VILPNGTSSFVAYRHCSGGVPVNQAGRRNRLREVPESITSRRDSRLRCGWQLDRDARARGRAQRVVGLHAKQTAATLVRRGGCCGCGFLMRRRNRDNAPAIFADIERSGFHRRSILLLWADTIRDRGLAVMVCVSLPSSTITPRSSIWGAPGPGTN
jgi:hypothetical protein